MHAAQLGFAWNAVGVLWLVGGLLTVVRIRLDSVAASTIVHAVYNGFIFAPAVLCDGRLPTPGQGHVPLGISSTFARRVCLDREVMRSSALGP